MFLKLVTKVKRKVNRIIGRLKGFYFKLAKLNPNTSSLWDEIWTGKTDYGEMKEDERIKLYKYIASIIPEQELNLLDMGCGDGEFLRHVNDKVKKNGVDFSKTGIAKARQKVKGNVYVRNINGTKFDNSSFDVVTIVETLEHVDNPESVLNEAKRLLKSGGKLIISVPHPEHDIYDIRAWPECYSLHIHSFTFESLKNSLLKLDFNFVVDKTALDTLIVGAIKR